MSKKIGNELVGFWTCNEQQAIDNLKRMKEVGFDCVFWPLLLNEQGKMEKLLQAAADLDLEIDELHEMPTNINHICRRINQTGHFYAEDVADLKARQAEIWQLLKQTQKDELPP